MEPNVIKSGSHTDVAKLSAGLSLEKLNVKVPTNLVYLKAIFWSSILVDILPKYL